MLSSPIMRSSASARILLEVAGEYGISPTVALRGTGLRTGDLRDPASEILSSQEQTLIENIVNVVGENSSFAVDAGTRYSLGLFGMIGFAFMSSPTLRDTVELSLRYQDLAFTLARCELVRARSETSIRFHVDALPAPIRQFVVELSMTTIWLAMSDLGGRPPVARAELSFGPPSHDHHLAVFGTLPAFRAEANQLVFADSYLDAPRPLVDPQARELCEEQCKALLARRRARIGAAGLVRERLSRAARQVPTMAGIANDLNTSIRTLRRSLDAEGTSFRELDEEARRTRAETLLVDSDMSLDQIAQKLGYATSSALTRAFKRWHDIPPGRWRTVERQRRPAVR